MIAITALALLVPYPVEWMAIIGSVSIACDVYIFPSVFYVRVIRPSLFRKIRAYLIAVFGIVGSLIGLSIAVPHLIQRIEEDSIGNILAIANIEASVTVG